MKWYSLVLTLAFSVQLAFCGNDIDPHFKNWMLTNLGAEETAAMIRDDLVTGSFGGGALPTSTTDIPVVLVHGFNNEAGTFWKVRANLTTAGFPKQYIFATTWGNGAEPLNVNVNLTCSYVQHTRRFFEIVKQYTGASQINVIAYSMGAPLARKAILGGECVDDSTVNVGAPMTSSIYNFVSVAGANRGAQLCTLPVFQICNTNTGLFGGSDFISDVNSQSNYESTNKKYNLASTGDEIVGYCKSLLFICLEKYSEYTGSQEYKLTLKNHQYTCQDTALIQLQMLRSEI